MRYVSGPNAQLLCVLILFASHANGQESKELAKQPQQTIDQEVNSIVQAARDLLAEGKEYSALKKLQSGIKGKHSDAILLLERASIYESLGKLDKMRTELELATKADPTSAETFAQAGSILFEFDFDAAIGLLSKAIELDPEYLPAYKFRSMALVETNDLEAGLRERRDRLIPGSKRRNVDRHQGSHFFAQGAVRRSDRILFEID